MQTIQKRKQWVLIALALIATLTLQLFTPITAHAEESTFENASIIISSSYKVGNNEYTQTDNIAISRSDYVHSSTIVCDVGSKMTYYYLYLYSNSPFSFTHTYSRDKNGENNDNSINTYTALMCEHGIYCYKYLLTTFYDSDNNEYYGMTGAPNVRYCDSSTLPSLCDLESEIDLSKDDYEEINELDASNSSYDADIDRPIIVVDNELNYSFSNAVDGYMYEVKGRWYSVDDIELYKERLQWKYKYYSIEKNELTNWVSVSDKRSVSDTSSLVTIGNASFDDYLKSHYIPNRTYTGGTDSKGNYYLGYNDALTRLKELLASPYSVYNSPEIYVRYFYKDSDGLYHYGKWTHYYTNLAAQAGSSGSLWTDKENILTDNQSEIGLTDSQLNDLENTDSSRNDTDIETTYHNTNGNSVIIGDIEELQDADFSNITVVILNLYEQTKTVFSMFTTVMSFLPQWVLNLIGTSVAIICLVGIWKAIT